MKRAHVLVGYCLLLITSVGFGATLHSMGKDQVQQEFENKTFTTISSTLDNKLIPNRFKAYTDKNGTINGMFISKPSAKAPQRDQGTWLIKSDGAFCVTWKNWNSGNEICIYVFDTKNSYIFLNANGNLQGTLKKEDVVAGNQVK